jgi:hypothetical protein
MGRMPSCLENALLAALAAAVAACAPQPHRTGMARVAPHPSSEHSDPRLQIRPCLLAAIDCRALAATPPRLCLVSTARCPMRGESYQVLVQAR